MKALAASGKALFINLGTARTQGLLCIHTYVEYYEWYDDISDYCCSDFVAVVSFVYSEREEMQGGNCNQRKPT